MGRSGQSDGKVGIDVSVIPGLFDACTTGFKRRGWFWKLAMPKNVKRIVDLFCGGGGASMGLHWAFPDATIVGVDINKQTNYPFEFVQANALDFDIRKFDFIWASPPCQSYTKKSANWGRKRTHWIDHPDLLGLVRKKLIKSGSSFVIENVVGAPIRADLMLCGTMFNLKIIKHRHFETNFKVVQPDQVCNHSGVYNPWAGKGRSAEKLRRAQNINWLPISGGASRKLGNTGDLFNAIPPAYSEYIADQYKISESQQ